MNDSSTISRIYDLKSIGVQNVIADLDAIIVKFNQVASAKKSIAEAKANIFDPTVISQVNTQLDRLNDIQAQTLTQLKEINTTTKQGVTAQGEYAAALTKVATGQNNVTMAMDESTASLGGNLSATTAGLTKMQAALTSVTRSNIDYDAAISSLGGRLALLKEEAEATSQQLKILGDEYRGNKISEEEYRAESEGLTIQLQQQKTQVTEVTAAMTALNKVYNPALLEEENANLALNRVELQQRNQLLKLQATAELAAEGSISEARSQAALYRKELNNLNLTTEEGIARQKELIATIAELDLFIKENADLYTRQKINIGNYPTIAAEASALKNELTRLTLAEEGQSEEALKLTARLKQLAAAQALVKEETTQSATVGTRFGSIVERMGLRMIANLLIFQAAIEIFTILSDKFTAASKAAEKYNEEIKKADDSVGASTIHEQQHIQVLLAIARDTSQAMNIRVEAVKKLQDEYPNYLANLSQEAILTGEITDKINELNAALFNKSLMEASEEKVKIAARRYADFADKIRDVKNELANLQKQQEEGKTDPRVQDQLKNNPYGSTATEYGLLGVSILNKREDLKDLTADLEKAKAEIDKFNADVLKYGKAAAGVIVDPHKDPKGKEPHDYTNAILEAQKKLNDALAKSAEERIKLEMEEQKTIFDNTENSLADRLKAYAVYATDEKRLLQMQSDTAIKDVQDKLDKIKEIEGKSKKDRTVAEQTLFINKEALTAQMDALKKTYDAQFYNLGTAINRDIAGIVKSGLDAEFKTIDAELNSDIKAITDKYTDAELDVYESKKPQAKKEKRLGKLDQGRAVEDDEAKLKADADKINSTEISLQQAHNSKLVELEGDLRRQLLNLYRQEAEDKKKYVDDVNKKDEDGAELRRQIEQTAVNVATSFANDYMQLLAKRDAYEDALAHKRLDYSHKEQQALTQSKQQQTATERAYNIAQDQMAREKAMKEKRRAEAQMEIDYASAVMRILASYKGDFGVTEGIEIAGVTAIYAGKLAMVESAPAYATGTGSGSHPGGLAWVGDGGQSELAKIGNSYYITPSNPTLVNMPAGSQVAPLSQVASYGGTMGSQLQAPRFYSSSSGGSNSDYAASFAEIHATLQTVTRGLANMKVIQQDAGQIKSSISKAHYKKVTL